MINICCLLILVLCKKIIIIKKTGNLVVSRAYRKFFDVENHDFSVHELTKKLRSGKMSYGKCLSTGQLWCSYKNICFSELVCNSSVLVLMVYSYKDVFECLSLQLLLVLKDMCTYIGKLSKKLSASSSKRVKKFHERVILTPS